jgi:hypothetical protein
VLSELAERIDPEKLAAAAATAAVPWAQRLGYLLERVGAGEKVAALKEYVRARAHESAPLLPNAPKQNSTRRKKAARNERLEALYQFGIGAGPVIPRDYITEWRREAPWVQDFPDWAQAEGRDEHAGAFLCLRVEEGSVSGLVALV